MTKRSDKKKVNYKKEESKISKEYSECVGKVGKIIYVIRGYKPHPITSPSFATLCFNPPPPTPLVYLFNSTHSLKIRTKFNLNVKC